MNRKSLALTLLLGLCGSLWAQAQQVYDLQSCIQTALQQNKELQNKQLDLDKTNLLVKEAASSFLPTINGYANYQYYLEMPRQLVDMSKFLGGAGGGSGTEPSAPVYQEVVFGVPQSLNAGIQVNQMLFNHLALMGLKAARTAQNSSMLQLAMSREELVYNVSATFYNGQVLQQSLSLLDSNLRSLEKLEQIQRQLLDNQLISKSAYKRLQINLENLRNERANLLLAQERTHNLLKFLMGVPVQTAIALQPFQLEQPSDGLKPSDGKERTDLKLLREQVTLSMMDRKTVVSEYFPRLSATFSYNVAGNNSEFSPFHSIQDKWFPSSYVGLQLQVPIFSGLNRYFRLQQKTLAVRQRHNQLAQLEQNASREIADAYSSYLSGRNALQNNERSMHLAEELFRDAQLEYQQGLVSMTDLLQAQDDLTRARNNYTTAIIQLRLSELALQKANGTLMAQ